MNRFMLQYLITALAVYVPNKIWPNTVFLSVTKQILNFPPLPMSKNQGAHLAQVEEEEKRKKGKNSKI